MAKNVYYIGVDDKYWNQLQTKLKEAYKSEKFHFKRLFNNELDRVQKLIIPIIQSDPDIIFIDYTAHPPKMLTLARSLRRCLPKLHAIIGLWDYLSTTEQLDESNITGVYVNHIKSGEFSEIIYQAYRLAMQTEIPHNPLAKVVPTDPIYWDLLHQMKLGFMTDKYLHAEHDLNFGLDDTVELQIQVFPQFPVKFVKVAEKIDQDFYYHFKHCSNLKLIYDESEIPADFNLPAEENDGPSSLQKNVADAGPSVAEKNLIIKRWIEKKLVHDVRKKTRVLIIDHQLNLLKQTERPIDSFPFSIRYYNKIDHDSEIISRVKAGIIVYNFFLHTLPITAEGEGVAINKNISENPEVKIDGLFVLELLLKKINEIVGYAPIILVTHSPYSSEDFQQRFNYQHIMADSLPFDFQKVLNLCEAYGMKGARSSTHNTDLSLPVREKRVYFDKSLKESLAQVKLHAIIKELTESSMIFDTHVEIPPYTIFQVREPVPMFVTVIPALSGGPPSNENGFEYFACLHGMGEHARADLRVFINQLIFAPKMKERAAELAATQEKKAAYLAQKEEKGKNGEK